MLKPIIYIIDPGHGGSNNGCEAKDFREKDWTLDLSEKILYYANELPGNFILYRSRTSDKYISLSRRAKQAKLLNASYGLSIHIDSEASETLNGCHYYCFEGDRISEKFANSIYDKIPFGLRPEKKKFIRWIPLDPAYNGYKKRARNVIRPYYERGIISGLLECGYISNARDYELITDETIKHELAGAIVFGLMSLENYYKFRRGDFCLDNN